MSSKSKSKSKIPALITLVLFRKDTQIVMEICKWCNLIIGHALYSIFYVNSTYCPVIKMRKYNMNGNIQEWKYSYALHARNISKVSAQIYTMSEYIIAAGVDKTGAACL